MTLTQHGMFDHCLAIDCKIGIIVDSSAQYLLMIFGSILKFPGGDDARRFSENGAREVVQARRNQNKIKARKRDKRD